MMSTPENLAEVVRCFLKSIEPATQTLPDPFADAVIESGKCSGVFVPVGILGHLARLSEEMREIQRTFVWERGAAHQRAISRGGQTTAFDKEINQLFRKEEMDRCRSREKWFGELSSEIKEALDTFCLLVSREIISAHIPAVLPLRLHGPLARLAMEHATITRRAATERRECEHRFTYNRPGNRTVIVSFLNGLNRIEAEAKSQLIGRWFRELQSVHVPITSPVNPLSTHADAHSVVATKQFLPLNSWAEIIATLKDKAGCCHFRNDEKTRELIRKQNVEHNGPIQLPEGRGSQPFVNASDLIPWWNGLADELSRKVEDQRARRDSKELTVKNTHNYSKSGVVVPGIDGTVKTRRKHSKGNDPKS